MATLADRISSIEAEIEGLKVEIEVNDEPEPIIKTKFSTKAASDFAASNGSNFDGLGMTSHMFRLDLSKVSETRNGEKNTQKDHLDKLIQISTGLITSTWSEANCALSDYKCDVGFASNTSVADGINVVVGIARGIFEMKYNSATPAEATRQGISEAFNLAVAQLQLNISYMDVMIPRTGSNGYLIEFSCLILVVKLSKVSDLTDESDLIVAARYFKNIINRFYYELTLRREASSIIPSLYIQYAVLSTQKFYLKPLSDFFQSKDWKRIFGISDCHPLKYYDTTTTIYLLSAMTPSMQNVQNKPNQLS
eukprot:gene7171-9776_t